MSSDARPSVFIHATEELLEEYSFGRACEPQLGWLEEHLLICAKCQAALSAIDEYVSLMKSGLAALERERQSSPVPPARLVRPASLLRFSLLQIPMANLLLAAALLLIRLVPPSFGAYDRQRITPLPPL